jgi:hypothetical protein
MRCGHHRYGAALLKLGAIPAKRDKMCVASYSLTCPEHYNVRKMKECPIIKIIHPGGSRERA